MQFSEYYLFPAYFLPISALDHIENLYYQQIYQGQKSNYYKQPPVITVSGSGASAGYVNYWEVPIFASDCSTIEEKDLNIKYIYYFLKSRQQELLDKQVGVAIPHVSPKDIYPLLISYPTDKDEQQYIVKTLDAVAEMIKLRKETIQLTKDLIPAIFQEMFGDPERKICLADVATIKGECLVQWDILLQKQMIQNRCHV